MDDDETKSLLESGEEALLKSPTTQKVIDLKPAEKITAKKVTLKRNISLISTLSDTITASEKSVGTVVSTPTGDEPPKKIRITVSDISSTENTKATASIDADEKDDNAGDKKIVKLSELSMKERLELRAKKFGGPLDPALLKISRAERFGLTGNSDVAEKKSSKIAGVNEIPSMEILKKRMERFGVVSSQMAKLEADEKLEKRKMKFGGKATESSITPAVALSDVEYAEKAKKRLERFNENKTEVK